jgi:hypothetical protein
MYVLRMNVGGMCRYVWLVCASASYVYVCM